MAIRKLFSLVSLVAFAFACSRQSEGERCMMSNGNPGDCEDGLVCQQPSGSANVCLDGINDDFDCLPHRCCPPAGTPPSDSRCIGYSVASGVAATGGASAGGNSATGGSSSVSSSTGGTPSADDGGVTDAGGTSPGST